ncbi:MAG: hypothetical protein ABIQ81_02270 [Novosphingobium sp.]
MNWWLGMTRDVALLGAESAEVMARRTLVLARADRAAWVEFQVMVCEKVAATVELQSRFLSSAFGNDKEAAARSALDHVRRKVRANRRRLRK